MLAKLLSYKILYTILLLLLCSTSYLFAQQNQYQFEHLEARDGLASNQVNSIIRDKKGFIWIGTLGGLSRYDGYTFKVFKHKEGDTSSINNDYIHQVSEGPLGTLLIQTRNGWDVFDPQTEKFSSKVQRFLTTLGIRHDNFSRVIKDNYNNFWFIFPGVGLYKYNPTLRTTTFYSKQSKASPLYSNNVTFVRADNAGNLWIIYTNGVLQKMNIASGRLIGLKMALNKQTANQDFFYKLFVDADNDLWIYNTGAEKGIYYYKTATDSLISINKESKVLQLNNNIVNVINQDEKGNIWVGTDHGGINIIDKKKVTVRYLTNQESDSKTISHNSITALYKDFEGIVWVGTFKKGLNFFHESSLKFPLYQYRSQNVNSLAHNDVNKFVEDKKGNLWIGTNGGGLLYFNRTTGTYKQYLHDPKNANSLSNNVIVSLCLDRQDKLWIGSYFGGLDCFDGKNFTNYKHDVNNPHSLADDRVWEIFEDSQNRLWVGTLAEGLELFDRTSKKFIHHKPGTGNFSKSGYVSSIIEDRSGNIWVGTASGINVLNKQTGQFSFLQHIENDKTSLSHNNIIELMQDSRGLIWVATLDGLNYYDPQKKIFTSYNVQDGLPFNKVSTILEDEDNNLWLGTPNGLSNAIVSTGANKQLKLKFINYNEASGLQSREFNENAALVTKKGELIFGGANGFNIFLPSKITESNEVPGVILTDLQVFNKSVTIGEAYNGDVILSKSIADTKEINLKYNQNVFTIEFAALRFFNASKIKYAYQLQGFSSEWLTVDAKNRNATFTNLDPGHYTLLVKAFNENGVGSPQPLALQINILPPFWLTPWAFCIYIALFVLALIFGRNLIIKRAQLKFAIERERQEANKLHELDMMKIKFFTNVSHEFRTPLTLIISPVERMLKHAENVADKKQLQLVYRNARRLLNLVNQLLDFRKLEEQELRLNKTTGDIIQFIEEIFNSFTDVAENKGIKFSFSSTHNKVFTDFDHDKIERILFNLLSNAFKFTPAGGEINVVLEVSGDLNQQNLQIKVTDTGIGIATDKQEKIFERFFQNDIPGTMVNQGSGIGLAITKEFIKLHGGTITVKSEPGNGSCFTTILPIAPVLQEKAKQDEVLINSISNKIEYLATLIPEPLSNLQPANGKKKTLLLVEDNDDFRFYLKDNLKAFYNIIEANNGKSGWQKALADHPDLVVCDITMPDMNGIDLCRKLKADNRTNCIPVILLTALSGEDQHLAGLQTGANDYMTKPFNFEILLSKVKNLLLQQDAFKKTYQKQVQVQASEVVTESLNDKFIQQALTVIEKNISNPDFSVEEMSREMFMSRVALYKKIFSLTGKTPIEFIRSIRLQRALQLLEKKELTVAEVAYEVGFNNPKNFTRYFKEAYNVLPSSYLSNKSNKELESDVIDC